METKLISRTDTEAQFSVKLSEDELRRLKAEIYDRLRPRVKAAGFRPGKAPDSIVERELGASQIQSEFIEHAVEHTYAQAVKELELPVVASPGVTLEKFVPYTELVYRVQVELIPKVKLADYKKIRIKRPETKVDPAEIDATLEDLRRRVASRLTVDRPAKTGDEVNFDFVGTKDGKAVPGASAKNQTLQLGSGSFIPGFEEQLVGLKPAAETTFDIRFPKDYHEQSLADQVVTFKVKLNSITELVLPELNREFVSQISPFTSLGELKADIQDKLAGEKAAAASREYEKLVLDKLLKDSDYKLPESLVSQQLERLRSELEQNLASSGLNLEKYAQLTGKTLDQFNADLRPEAERRVGLALVLTEVAAAENLSITAPELDTEIARLRQDYPDPEAQAELANPHTREEVYNHLLASKVIAQLIGYAEDK
jgi:trigger factor